MRTFYDAKRMREEVNTEQGTAKKKSEIPSFYEARKKKKESVSDFLCSCSAAVLARSRSHYLCIRKNLSAQRPSRFYIKNSKWKINHISTRHGSPVQKSAPKRSRTSATTRKHRPQNGTYHKHDNGDGGLARKCSIAMRSSCHCPCPMMTERNPP